MNPQRVGLRMTGGEPGGTFEETFEFHVEQPTADVLPLEIPANPGDNAGVIEMHRLAAPLPTLLPSYNQIGFDSLHYLIGFVEGSPENSIAWLVEARPTGPDGQSEIDPATRGMFPFTARWSGGLLTFENRDGLSLEVMNVVIGFDTFQVAVALDQSGDALGPAVVSATTICGDIPLYGVFLQRLGLCNPQTDILAAFGATLIRRHEGGVQPPPQGLGDVTMEASATQVTAVVSNSSLRLDEHSFAILLVDATTNSPISLPYGPTMQREADQDGNIRTVVLPLLRSSEPTDVRAYLMVGTYPAHRAELTIPAE